MFWVLVAYFAVSVLIGIIDIKALIKQDEYFSDLPAGDDGYFEERKPILGTHNLVFAPSLAIIKLYIKYVEMFV